MKPWAFGNGEEVTEESVLQRTERALIKAHLNKEKLVRVCLLCLEWHAQYPMGPMGNDVFATMTSLHLWQELDRVLAEVRG